jgi:TRAP-type C4-dicarboxylate transport system substrate-binding protein
MMKSLIAACALSIVATLLPPGANTAAARDLVYGILAPMTHPAVSDGMQPMAERLKKETNGTLNWKIVPNGQLLTGPGTLPGLRDGIADGGYLITPYARSDLPNTNFIGDLFQFGDNPLAIAAATTETVLLSCPECIDEFRKNNIVWLVGSGFGPSKLLCKRSVRSLADVKGKKVKGTGGVEARWVEAMGGVHLNMTAPDAVVAIERGTIDCMIGPTSWIRAYGLWDVVRHVPDANMGIFRTMSLLTLNRKVWRDLSPAEKRVMMKEAAWVTANFTITGQLGADISAEEEGKKKGIEFGGGKDIDKLRIEHVERDRAVLVTDATKRGVRNAAKLLDNHLADISKWEKITAGMGSDVDKFADAIWREIYAKLDPDKI